MARPRKYTTDTLLTIIERYLSDNEYITKLTYANLTEYAKGIGYEKIDWQDFGRNKEIKKFVEEYNKQKKLTMYSKLNSDKLAKLDFNVEDIVDKNIKDTRQLKAILKVFKEGYDKAFNKIIENEEIIKECKVKIEEQLEVINQLKEKNKSLRLEIKEIRETNKSDKNIEKERYIYSLLKYIIDTKNVPINDEEDILNILKNLINLNTSDVMDEKEILEKEFKIENEIEQNTKEEENIISINKNKLNLPDFMK